MQSDSSKKPPQTSSRIFGIDGARHSSAKPNLVAIPSAVKRGGLQASDWMVDAGGRRYRPAVIKVLQNAALVRRQVEERGGDIIGVAKIHRVGCNDIGRAMVLAKAAA